MDLIWDSAKLKELKTNLPFTIEYFFPIALKEGEICVRLTDPKMHTGDYINNILTYSIFSLSPVSNNVCELKIVYYGMNDQGMYMEDKTRELLSSTIKIAKKYNLYDINFKLVYLENIFEDIKKIPSGLIARILTASPKDNILLAISDNPHIVKITIPSSIKYESDLIAFVSKFIYDYVNNSIKSFVSKATPENVLSHYIDYLKKNLNNK